MLFAVILVVSDVNHHSAVIEEDCYANLLSDSGRHVANGDTMITKLSRIKDQGVEFKWWTFVDQLSLIIFTRRAGNSSSVYKLYVRLFAIRCELINLSFKFEQAVNHPPMRRAEIKGTTFWRLLQCWFPHRRHRLSLGCSARIIMMINRLSHRIDRTFARIRRIYRGQSSRFILAILLSVYSS